MSYCPIITADRPYLFTIHIKKFSFSLGGLGGSGVVDAIGKPYGSVTYPTHPGRFYQILFFALLLIRIKTSIQ